MTISAAEKLSPTTQSERARRASIERASLATTCMALASSSPESWGCAVRNALTMRISCGSA